MTKERLLKLLKKYAESYDNETAHFEADDALLKYINDKEISDAFNKIHKWYA